MTKINLEKCKSGNKGITLIALIITIIVLLILAGITISALTGSDSAPAKANEAKQKNDIGTVKDEIAVIAQNAHLEAYDDIYVKNNSAVSSIAATTTVGQRVINAVLQHFGGAARGTSNANDTLTATATKGLVSVSITQASGTADAEITLATRDFTQEGTIEHDGGTLTWKALKNNSGNPPAAEYTGLSQDTLLGNNNMAELTIADINADSSLTATQKTALTDTTTIKAVLTGNVPVPVGYSYVEGTSTSITKPTGGSYGVVIKDSKDNEWVWVPVPDASILYEPISGDGISIGVDNETAGVKETNKVASLNGIPSMKVAERKASDVEAADNNAANAVKINKRSKSISATEPEESEASTIVERGVDYREPALVIDDDFSYDNDADKYYYEEAGFSSAQEMAQAFKTDYNNMIDSINKYGGFYVGRYEVGYEAESVTETGGYQTTGSGAYLYGSGTKTGTVRAGVYPLDGVNWYQLYKVCSNLGDSKTTSTMIWGCQYDMVCKWSTESGDKVPYSQGHSDEYQASGADTNDVRNNVCDLEGSRCEWTQEAYSSSYRAYRGGDCDGSDSTDYRGGNVPYSGSNLGSRATLYIKWN